MRHRADCSRWVEAGLLRLNRVPVGKPHMRLRVGDVLTLPFPANVRVVEVVALTSRRGPAPVAHMLYREITDAPGGTADRGCEGKAESSYPPPEPGQAKSGHAARSG